jgi:GT2 family glycosyltransferase
VLVCVVNDALDAEVEELRRLGPAASEYIALESNLGFSAGVNAGMRLALDRGAEWVLLLNNDAVVAPSCLERCLREAAAHDVAVVGPAIAFADDPDRLWYGGGRVSRLFGYTRHRSLMAGVGDVHATGETEYVSGCCALVSAAAWRSVGEFREDFFTYYEDVDWCLRARDAGWRCRFVGEVLCWHAVSVSAGRRGSLRLSADMAYYLGRNPLRSALETHDPILRATRVLGILTVWNAYNWFRLLQARSSATVVAYLHGLVDAIGGRLGPRARSRTVPPAPARIPSHRSGS